MIGGTALARPKSIIKLQKYPPLIQSLIIVLRKVHRKKYLLEYQVKNKDKIAEQRRAYRANNRDKIAEQKRASRAKNKERIAKQQHEWYLEHAEERKAYQRDYRAKHIEEINKNGRVYHAKNREKHNKNRCLYYVEHIEEKKAYDSVYYKTPKGKAVSKAHAQRRRARKKAAGGILSQQDIASLFNHPILLCYYCGVRLNYGKKPVKATIDHIVPLSKGGRNELSNLVLACGRCNMTKSAKLLEDFKMTVGTLGLSFF